MVILNSEENGTRTTSGFSWAAAAAWNRPTASSANGSALMRSPPMFDLFRGHRTVNNKQERRIAPHFRKIPRAPPRPRAHNVNQAAVNYKELSMERVLSLAPFVRAPA